MVMNIGTRQPKLSPNLPKVVKHTIAPTGITVLKIPIAVPISRPLNHCETICADTIKTAAAPIPTITRPKPA
ncbi:hypothetical protein ES703_116267 [subsurface metagenome]